MAQAKGVPATDHDRVAMLSIDKTGKPDQHEPEIIGDKAYAEAATREQFRQAAVSAEDVRLSGVVSDVGTVVADAPQDPSIAEAQKAHEAAAKAGEKAADATVGALFTDDPKLQTGTSSAAGSGSAS